MATNYINEGFVITNASGEEEVILIPYNLENKLITEKDVIKLLNKFNVNIKEIKKLDIIQQAFIHKSYCKKDIFTKEILDCAKKELGNPDKLLDLFDNSYERLEYLGDRVLKLIVSNYLFIRYPKQDEGYMTRLQTKIEDKRNLSMMSKEMGLGEFFIISKQIEINNGRNMEKIHEDVFEAFIGSLFLSNGFEECLYLITNLLETIIDYSEKLYCDNNYKDYLLRIHHQNKWTSPTYVSITHDGPPHKRKYIMGVLKHDVKLDSLSDKIDYSKKCIGFGIGNSKRDGEQKAAKMSLIIYGKLNKDQYSNNDIYYPQWDKLNELPKEDEEGYDSDSSVCSNMSEKSV